MSLYRPLFYWTTGTPYKYDKVCRTSSSPLCLLETRSTPLTFIFIFFQTIKSHTKFVQDLRYAPSGDHFASVGSDGKVFLYDGKAGDILGEFEEGHKGTAVSLFAFNPSMFEELSL